MRSAVVIAGNRQARQTGPRVRGGHGVEVGAVGVDRQRRSPGYYELPPDRSIDWGARISVLAGLERGVGCDLFGDDRASLERRRQVNRLRKAVVGWGSRQH